MSRSAAANNFNTFNPNPNRAPRTDGRVEVSVGFGRVQVVDADEAEELLRQMEREERGF